MLWEEEATRTNRGCSSFLSLETLYKYLSLSSFMITLPCVLQFPLMTLRHGGAAFIIVYTILLLILIFPTALLQLLFSRMSQTNPVSIWAKFVPVSAGIGPGLVTTSILCSSVTLVDTAQSLIYMWSSFRNDVPPADTYIMNHHHEQFKRSPFFMKMNQMHQRMNLSLSEEAPMLSDDKDSLLLVETLIAGAFLLILTLLLKTSRLRYLQCILQAIVIILMMHRSH